MPELGLYHKLLINSENSINLGSDCEFANKSSLTFHFEELFKCEK